MAWLDYSARGVAKKVTLTTQPGGAKTGLPFTQQPAGKLVDGAGVLSRTSGTTVTASKVTGNGTLSGTLTQQTVDGLFAFTDLSLNLSSASATLGFAASGLTAATSNAFAVTTINTNITMQSGAYVLTGAAVTFSKTNRCIAGAGTFLVSERDVTLIAGTAGPATQLSIVQQPAGIVSGSPLSTQPTVQLKSAAAANVAEAGVEVTAYLKSGSGVLSGTVQVDTDANGLATFTNLTYTGAGDITIGFSAILSQVYNVWSDDVESDRSSSYFEVNTDGGVFGRASVGGSMRWRSQYSTGGSQSWGDLKLGFGRMPVGGGFVSVGPDDVDFGLVTMECDMYHSVNNLLNDQDKFARMTVFSAGDWSQAAIAHWWSNGTTHMEMDPVSLTDANGNVLSSGYNDFANMTFLGLTPCNTTIFGGASNPATTLRRYKCVMRLNDPGQANGYQQLYIDDVLDGEVTGLNFVSTYTDYGINVVMWENYRTGGSGKNHNRMFDNLTVTGQGRAVVISDTVSTPFTADAGAYTVTGTAVTLTWSGAGNPNEPSGMTVGFDEAWLTKPPTASSGAGWYIQQNASRVSVITDPTSPVSDHSCLQLYFPAGAPGGVETMWITYNESPGWSTTNNTGTLYLRMRVKLSSNWSDGGNNGTKFIWPRPRVENTAHFSPISRALGGMTVGFNFQGAFLGGADDDNEDPTPQALGVWHDVEWLLYQGSTASAHDGTIKIWVDGTLVVNEVNKQYANDGNALGWKYMDIAPTFGFGTNPVPHDQYIWIDHFYASYK